MPTLTPIKTLALALLFASHIVGAQAADAAATTTGAATDPQADCELRIGSGPAGKLYERMVRDIQSVCGAEVRVCAVPSVGGLPNLMMLSASQVELGLVQLDTLQQMAKGGDEHIAALQAVMPLHTNLLHILTLRDGSRASTSKLPFFGQKKVLRKFSELKGARVAVVGSTQLLGQTLNKVLNHGMELVIAESDDKAVELLNANQVQAIFTDGGWPLPSISRHTPASGLMLAEFDLLIQPPFVPVKRSYQNLDAFNLTFLGSPNLLVTRPFKPGGQVGRQVARLQSCLARQLDTLKEGRFQAGWKDIHDTKATLGVARFGG